MITELRISNFVLIDTLHLECSSGFQVLTGETGAGKSLLVDALSLLSGARASLEYIRAGAEEATVEAAFALPASSPLMDYLQDTHLASAPGEDLIIRRVLSRSGRNRQYVNGHLTPLHVIQELGRCLVDIHGQHEQQSLLTPKVQLEMLDAFGGLEEQRREFTIQYDRWNALGQTLQQTIEHASEQHHRQEFVRYQLQELEKAELRDGEEEELAEEHHRLHHAGRLSELAHEAYEVLYRSDSSVLDRMTLVSRQMEELKGIDREAAELSDLTEQAMVHLHEVSDRLRDYANTVEPDPARLEIIDTRLAAIQKLKKKYGESVNGLLRRQQELAQELEDAMNAEGRIEALRTALSAAHQEVIRLAGRLSTARRQAAKDLEQHIQTELTALHMGHMTLRIDVSSLPEKTINSTGGDRVDYLFSANPGEPPQPLGKVASGGELSRLMLAMKTVLAKADQVPILIFDEVDTGVGGGVAAVMGRRLQALGRFHQVFCITHLPQIASHGHAHFLIHKTMVKGKTVTQVSRLEADERKEEIARMLGGVTITPSVRKTAAEMLEAAGEMGGVP